MVFDIHVAIELYKGSRLNETLLTELAIFPTVTRIAGTRVGVNQITTRSPILTRVTTGTLVYICVRNRYRK